MADNPEENSTNNHNDSDQAPDRNIIEKTITKMSRSGKYASEKLNLTRMLMYSLAVNLGLFIILIFFSISFASVLNNRDVTILIPPGTHQDMSLVFGPTRVNRPVFEIYADYLARGFGNFNYENVDKVFNNLLQYADGSVKHEMHSILNKKAKLVKENFVTQTFKLQRIELARDARGTLARCYGYATRKVGKKVQFENLPYLFTFWFKSYRGNATIIGMSSRINTEPAKAGEKLKVDQYEKDNKYINF